jgi:hypothetical protein
MTVTIELKWDGYYSESSLANMAAHKCGGVYAVYRGTDENIKELLYIGRSCDTSGRADCPNHNARSCWNSHLQSGEKLWFSFADIDDEQRAESALIYHLTPPCNGTGHKDFHYEKTTVKNTGAHGFIPDEFTVW